MPAAWQDVVNNPQYLSLSPQAQSQAKIDYFNTVVANKPEYQSLDSDSQDQAKRDFFGGEQKTLTPQEATQQQQQDIAGRSPLAIAGKTLSNIAQTEPGIIGNSIGKTVGGIGNAIGGAWNAVTHPVETAQNIGNAVTHPVETAEGIGKGIGNYVGSRYGSPQQVMDTLHNDPVGSILDATTVAGGVGGALSKIGDVGKVGALSDVGNALKGAAATPYQALAQAPGAIGGVIKAAANKLNPNLSSALQESAQDSYKAALGPTTIKEGQLADKVTPQLAQRQPFVWTRQGLLNAASRNETDAANKLEQAYQALPQDTKFSLQPVIQKANDFQKSLEINGIVPQESMGIFNKIDAIKADLVKMTNNGELDAQQIRNYRQVLDKAVVASGKGFAVTGLGGAKLQAQRFMANTIRNEMAQQFPDVSKMNSEYSLWKNTTDLLGTTVDKGQNPLSQMGGVVGKVTGHPAIGIVFNNLGKLISNNVAWNTLSGSVKSRLAQALATEDTITAGKIINNLQKSPLFSPVGAKGGMADDLSRAENEGMIQKPSMINQIRSEQQQFELNPKNVTPEYTTTKQALNESLQQAQKMGIHPDVVEAVLKRAKQDGPL